MELNLRSKKEHKHTRKSVCCYSRLQICVIKLMVIHRRYMYIWSVPKNVYTHLE